MVQAQLSSQSMGVLRFGPCDGAMTLPSGPIAVSRSGRETLVSYKPEIVAKLRQVDVLVSQGQGMTEAIRQIGVSEGTYYRWRQELGGLEQRFGGAEERGGQALEGARPRERPAAQGCSGPDAGKPHSEGGCPGNLLAPARRRLTADTTSLPGNTAATAIARSQDCCARR